MQRDGGMLIDAWCSYHGYLFGFENLTVLDNGSTGRETVEILRRYERAGSTILWQYRSETDRANRQLHFHALARRDDGPEGIAIGLDCDEWLALFTADGLSCDRDAIMDYLERPTWRRPGVFGLGGGLVNVPTSAGFYCGMPVDRRAVSLGGEGAGASAVQPTNLVLVRFCNRPLVLADVPPRRKAPACVQLAGIEGLMTPARCRSHFADKLLVEFPALGRLADAIGLPDGWPVRAGLDDLADDGTTRIMMPTRGDRSRKVVSFESETYLRLNPDVAGAGWPALQHFIFNGVTEERRWV